jgi:hypothetical protein
MNSQRQSLRVAGFFLGAALIVVPASQARADSCVIPVRVFAPAGFQASPLKGENLIYVTAQSKMDLLLTTSLRHVEFD